MSAFDDALAELLTTVVVAAYLGCKKNTLEIYRLTGKGPPFIKIGDGKQAPVRYRRSDVEAWLAQRSFRSTSECSAKDGPR